MKKRDRKTGLPTDEYGHILSEEGEPLTDPYGSLEFCIGNEDDFICLDYAIKDHWLILHAVVNSETACFIRDYDYQVIDLNSTESGSFAALRMVYAAQEWAYNSEDKPIRFNNRESYNFAREVHIALCRYRGEAVPNFSMREIRLGGKRINKFCGLL